MKVGKPSFRYIDYISSKVKDDAGDNINDGIMSPVTQYLMTQYNLKAGLKKYVIEGAGATEKELSQLKKP